METSRTAVRLALPGSHIIHEGIEDEIVVVNLETGHYYSLLDSAARIWCWLLEGHTAGDIAAHTSIPADMVQSFVDGLLAEQLLRPMADAETPCGPSLVVAGFGKTLEPPSMERYTDMEQMLQLDPIHEVDERGWPRTAS